VGDNVDDKDFETYKMVLNLWAGENPIKTNKLQVLLAVNGLLVSAASVGDGFTARKWPVYLAGVVFSSIWVLSIGRTALFQSAWEIRLKELHEKYPADPRFAVLETRTYLTRAPRLYRLLGGIPSKSYLTLSPVVLALAWLAVLLLTRTGLCPIAR
jgi:K+ transporter